MLILKDDLSIELFDIEKLEMSIKTAIEGGIDAAMSAGGTDTYRSSPATHVAANVTYLFMRMGCAATCSELRVLICKELNADERIHYEESHRTDARGDGVLPTVSAPEQAEDYQSNRPE